MRTRTWLPESVTRGLRRWARDTPGCRLLVLFGSAASPTRSGVGEPDVDVAVLFRKPVPPEGRLRRIGEIQDVLGALRADVVFLHAGTAPVLRLEIFKAGVPLFEERPGLFVEEAVRALALHEDALPFRRALRKSLSRADDTA